MRDIGDYSKKYMVPGFEKYKVIYRRKRLLETIERYKPEKVLEIGCGKEPLFLYASDIHFTVVEPSDDFYENAVTLAKGREKVTCIKGFFEEKVNQLSPEFDMIICSSLLHEVEEPEVFLSLIAKLCNPQTIVHVVVPNANSMHRLLGMRMGMLADLYAKSQNNEEFQQNNVFDSESLKKIMEKSGFEILESGSFFVKPFSHEQMYNMMQQGILNEAVLDGLYYLTEYMPEFGSEIYVNCKLKR